MTFMDPTRGTPTLFHYTNAAGLIGIIKQRELWATGANYLNDPSEVSFAADKLATALRARFDERSGQQPIAAEALDLLERSYVDPNSLQLYREDRAFISSFSRSDESLTLWRLYAGRNGFCVGFDKDRLLQWVDQDYPEGIGDQGAEMQEEHAALVANYQLSARMEEVFYGEDAVQELLEEVVAIGELEEGSEQSEARLRRVFARLSTIKHLAYEDEREARLVVQEVHHHASDPSVRIAASGALVAYRKIVFPFGAVQSIAMAPGANAPQQRLALQSLMARGGRAPYGHVKIRETKIPFSW